MEIIRVFETASANLFQLKKGDPLTLTCKPFIFVSL